jgi:membrane dipeptidase
MYGRLLTLLAFMALPWVAGCGVSTFSPTALPEEAIMKNARDIHERVITLDTHVDFSPANFTDERNYTQRLDTQFNLPKMFEGGLDAVFFSIFVGQTREIESSDAFKPAGYERAYTAAIEKFDAVHRLVKQFAPDQMEFA